VSTNRRDPEDSGASQLKIRFLRQCQTILSLAHPSVRTGAPGPGTAFRSRCARCGSPLADRAARSASELGEITREWSKQRVRRQAVKPIATSAVSAPRPSRPARFEPLEIVVGAWTARRGSCGRARPVDRAAPCASPAERTDPPYLDWFAANHRRPHTAPPASPVIETPAAETAFGRAARRAIRSIAGWWAGDVEQPRLIDAPAAQRTRRRGRARRGCPRRDGRARARAGSGVPPEATETAEPADRTQ